MKLGDVCEKNSSNISANQLENNFWDYKIYGASWIFKSIDFFQESEKYIWIVKDWAWVWRIFLCEEKTSVLGTIDKIFSKNWNNLNFLYYVISMIDFQKYITWSTIPHIYFKDYKKIKIFLPTLEEQEKIADFLSEIDEKINLKEKEIYSTKDYKKGLLQKIFV